MNNWQYALNLDYQLSPGCSCPPDDYCRCKEISDVDVLGVDLDATLGIVKKNFVRSETDSDDDLKFARHLFERLLIRLFCDQKTLCHFVPSVIWGYYGQELDKVTLDSEGVRLVTVAVEEFNDLPTNSARFLSLMLREYGFLHPKFEGVVAWEMKKVATSAIQCNERVLKVTRPAVVKNYVNQFEHKRGTLFPGLVVVPSGDDNYRFIDGHHRFSAIKELQDKYPKKWGYRKVMAILPRKAEDT